MTRSVRAAEQAGPDVVDAVVVGSGPNGLVAANLLADAGWDVLVLEAADRAGGAVASAEITSPGFRNDLCSAFYSLVAASPVLRELNLGEHGLRWRYAPAVLAHVLPDGRHALLSRDVDTAPSCERLGPSGREGARRARGQRRSRGVCRTRRDRPLVSGRHRRAPRRALRNRRDYRAERRTATQQ